MRIEHRVVEIATGRIALAFFETEDYSHAYDPGWNGVSSVVVDTDGQHVIVRYHNHHDEDRIRIPDGGPKVAATT